MRFTWWLMPCTGCSPKTSSQSSSRCHPSDAAGARRLPRQQGTRAGAMLQLACRPLRLWLRSRISRPSCSSSRCGGRILWRNLQTPPPLPTRQLRTLLLLLLLLPRGRLCGQCPACITYSARRCGRHGQPALCATCWGAARKQAANLARFPAHSLLTPANWACHVCSSRCACKPRQLRRSCAWLAALLPAGCASGLGAAATTATSAWSLFL